LGRRQLQITKIKTAVERDNNSRGQRQEKRSFGRGKKKGERQRFGSARKRLFSVRTMRRGEGRYKKKPGMTVYTLTGWERKETDRAVGSKKRSEGDFSTIAKSFGRGQEEIRMEKTATGRGSQRASEWRTPGKRRREVFPCSFNRRGEERNAICRKS